MLDTSKDGGRVAKRAEGERSKAAAGAAASGVAPDPELVDRASRRRFTAEYKLSIVREADRCSQPGEIGSLLRREGLYSSHLASWRKQRDAGALDALARPRGRKKPDPLERENAELKARLGRAEAELARARTVIDVQGNVSALLETLLEPRGAKHDGNTGS